MLKRNATLIGGGFGLLISSAVLTLDWLGVGGIVMLGHTDLVYILWPSSVMLVGGWRNTIPGIMITLSAVAINCLMYITIALLLRAGIQAIRKPKS